MEYNQAGANSVSMACVLLQAASHWLLRGKSSLAHAKYPCFWTIPDLNHLQEEEDQMLSLRSCAAGTGVPNFLSYEIT